MIFNTSIKIKKTGNFWIDSGIVALYKVLAEKYYDRVILSNSYLEINFNDNEVEAILNDAKDIVTQKYLTQTNNVGWYYSDNQFKIYRKTDYKMHLKSFFIGKTPSTEGALHIAAAKDSDLSRKDKKMTEKEYENFIAFKEQNRSLIINNKKVTIPLKGYINSPPKYEIGKAFNINFLKSGQKLCIMSGYFFDKTRSISGMNYPFLTSQTGELNFSSHLTKKNNISLLYDFISIFSFYNIKYLRQQNLNHYFILHDSNLKKLSEFLNTIKVDVSHLKNSDFCNFETQITGTVYENEGLFNFLISIYLQVKDQFEDELFYEDLNTKSVFTLFNDGNIFRDVKEYSSLSRLFSLFRAFENVENDDKNYFNYFLSFIRHFNKKLDSKKYDTTYRNKVCGDIISFKNIHKTIESFIGEVKLREENGGIAYLDKIILIYNSKTQKNMKLEMVEMCKSIGNRIGAYCRENDDKGILFSIRNAKNRTEFLNVLAETQFRTGVSYSESFFKELPEDSEWEEYKSLVSIFAMNSFLYKKQ